MGVRVSFPRRAAAWCAGLALGVPTAVSALWRAVSVADGQLSWSQFWSQTVSNFVWHAAVVVAVFGLSWLVVRSSSSAGVFARLLVMVAGALLLTWSWVVQTADTPMGSSLSAPAWAGWVLLALNAVIMWRWVDVLVVAATPKQLRRRQQ